jgi:DNA invertase Pin-like site-specific DNA recombinase
MKYGSARVSPGGKSESVDAQVRQLTKAGCRKVVRDVHVSGAKTDRAQLRRVIETLESGDVVMVTRLDRLARSTRDLLNTLAAITERKAGFPVFRRCMGRHDDITWSADADRSRRPCRVRA